MSTYREATSHARAGGTVLLGDKIIRFLTREEAEPILLATRPDRIAVRDKDGKIVVQEIAPPTFRLQRLGLYDVGQHPPIEFRATEEDIAGDWVIESAANEEVVPEVVPPETVDEVLHETTHDEPL